MEDIIKDNMQLDELLNETLGDTLYQIVISNSRDKQKALKIKIRPVMLKERLCFQETLHKGTQVFHNNYEKEQQKERILTYMSEDFRQCEIETALIKATVLVSKKGKLSVNRKTAAAGSSVVNLLHNRVKSYILEEGTAVPFLIDLGVQSADGRIIRSKYDKFKQINRFLEFIEDILPTLPKERTIRIIDFGCGKSYLTFAIYYYLYVLQRRRVLITGLDLKKDVIRHCSELAVKYGYEGLHFTQGDIKTYSDMDGAGRDSEAEPVDMVVTLHACDTATDYALLKAVEWKAGVILSVPCCQHEVNRQIANEEWEPVLKYGLIKERMSALITDAVRANLLEEQGYEVQLLEFIDMEHTPKNLLIRAVKKREGSMQVKDNAIRRLTEQLNIETTLQKLLL